MKITYIGISKELFKKYGIAMNILQLSKMFCDLSYIGDGTVKWYNHSGK